jgi:lauroyl/myristoyl acyltransferase
MRRGPSLLLTAHFHNWERLGSDLRTLGVPLLAAAMPLRNPWANRLLVKWRRRWDLTVVTERVSRTGLTHVRGNGCFAFLWDQDSPGSKERGRFHGVPVRMNPVPEFLRTTVDCPVFFGVLLPDGRMRLIRLMGDGNRNRVSLQGRYHRVLETLVRKHPEYWYGFFHARFKDSTRYPGR